MKFHPHIARRAFTLIEVMIVVSIVAVIITAGVPMVWKALAKNQMAKAVNDVIEGCKSARDRAIVHSRPYDFVVRNESAHDATLLIEPSKLRDPGAVAFPGATDAVKDKQSGSLMEDFPRKLGQDVAIELVAVNMADVMKEKEARVRFYPNGTSDEFTIVLRQGGVQRRVSVDIVTGLAYEVTQQQ
jgi:prepilin-type N-terminal cleavage/methylation domain-containing protein